MPDYRFHLLDDKGTIVRRIHLVLDDHQKAFMVAHDYCADLVVEVWAGDRLVYVLNRERSAPDGQY